MSEAVWVSEAMASSRLDFPMTNDLVVKDRGKVIEAGDIYKNGGSLPPQLCPNRIWFKPDRPMRKLPDLFHPGSYYVVSERAADILRQFDLGGGALYPVREGIYKKDNKTRIEGEYFTWIFGNVKRGFMPDESPKKMYLGPYPPAWWHMPYEMTDGDMAVSRKVLEGPDVWVDPLLSTAVFLRGRLVDALIKAGLKRAFMLYRCRVI